jgi:hypothetical protein
LRRFGFRDESCRPGAVEPRQVQFGVDGGDLVSVQRSAGRLGQGTFD